MPCGYKNHLPHKIIVAGKEPTPTERKNARFWILHGTGGLRTKDLERFPLEEISVDMQIKKRFKPVFKDFNLTENDENKAYNIIAAHLDIGLHVNTLTGSIVSAFWGKDGEAFITPKVMKSSRFIEGNKRQGVRSVMSPRIVEVLKRMEDVGYLTQVKSADERKIFIPVADDDKRETIPGSIYVPHWFRSAVSKYNFDPQQINTAFGIISTHLHSENGMRVAKVTSEILDEFWGEDGELFRTEKTLRAGKGGFRQKVKNILYNDISTAAAELIKKEHAEKKPDNEGKPAIWPILK